METKNWIRTTKKVTDIKKISKIDFGSKSCISANGELLISNSKEAEYED